LSADPVPEAVRLAVIIVTHESSESLPRTLPAVLGELREGDELIVVDNASSDGSAALARELAPAATVIEAGANLGYGAGNNRGAGAASAELLCFLNPDAVPAPGFRDAIAAPASGGRDWGAWQGLVTADGGRVVNTRGGAVHFTGIAWAGGAGEPLDADELHSLPEPGFVSGACLAIPRKGFLYLEGFDEEFFLYHEDVDLSLRLRLSDAHLGIEPSARVEHAYEFDKGPAKWRYLERNRWATVIRTYPAGLLALLLPALLLTELALVPVSIAGGWFGQKLRAWSDTVRWLPRLLNERRAIHSAPTVPACEFAAGLTPDLESAYLGAAGRSRLLRAGLRAYWAVVLAVLGKTRR
jgi:N-acetylglucosaminyl-diphospho-decaprenol L-rhamnosyltransferase